MDSVHSFIIARSPLHLCEEVEAIATILSRHPGLPLVFFLQSNFPSIKSDESHWYIIGICRHFAFSNGFTGELLCSVIASKSWKLPTFSAPCLPSHCYICSWKSRNSSFRSSPFRPVLTIKQSFQKLKLYERLKYVLNLVLTMMENGTRVGFDHWFIGRWVNYDRCPGWVKVLT